MPTVRSLTDIALIRFEGKHAAEYAEEYANWKNWQTKVRNEEMGEKAKHMKLAS